MLLFDLNTLGVHQVGALIFTVGSTFFFLITVRHLVHIIRVVLAREDSEFGLLLRARVTEPKHQDGAYLRLGYLHVDLHFVREVDLAAEDWVEVVIKDRGSKFSLTLNILVELMLEVRVVVGHHARLPGKDLLIPVGGLRILSFLNWLIGPHLSVIPL